MRFQFCPHCGSKPVLKEIGDEGLVPWCENCKLPLFPMFATCIIALAVNEDGEVALLRQGYLSQQYHVPVSYTHLYHYLDHYWCSLHGLYHAL